MLTIRKAQKRQLARAHFKAWARVHVQRFFPAYCAHLGASRVEQDLEEAVLAAEQLGFEGEAELARFVDLTFVFGPRFHEDARFGWAASILADASLTSAEARMQRLHRAGLDHLRKLAASKGDRARGAR